MGKPKRLSDLEWEVMQAIWQMEGPVTVRQVLEKAFPKGQKAYTTVQTVMNHLVSKGFLQREKIGLVNFYSPTLSQEQILDEAVEQFLNKTFAGSLTHLFHFLLDRRQLKPEEIEELKQLIASKEKENKP